MSKVATLLLSLLLLAQPANAMYYGNAHFRGHNDFGDGHDGAITYSVNTNIASVLDGPPVVLNLQSLTINSGVTVSVSNRCRGLIIYVTGNVNIAGTLTMTGKGTPASCPSEGINLQYTPAGVGNTRGLLTDYWTPAVGAAGGASVSVANTSGNPGVNGSAGQTGGGGSGGNGDSSTATSGAGAAGSCYCGGSGGGGTGFTTAVTSGGAASAGGATGGSGGSCSNADAASGGGSGNPVGVGSHGSASSNVDPTAGGGGQLWIIARGNVTISGTVSSDGSGGGSATGASNGFASGGAGSGAGRIGILYGGTFSNTGSIHANGGTGGTGSGSTSHANGGAGGNGTVTTAQVSQ